MLLALILRGVAFEFRFRFTGEGRNFWDMAFIGGSVVATLMQGIMVGAFVQGVHVENGAYAGGWFDWLSPFSVLCGIALVVGYALLGASWLVIKLSGDLQARMRALQLPLGAVTIILIALVSIGTLFESEMVRERWFSAGATLFIWIIPVFTAALSLAFFLMVRAKREVPPFLLALGLFTASFAGLAASLYPHMIPPMITYRDAANADGSLAFMLIGALIMLPIVLGYTGYSYWLFRGKVKEGEGYH
jgi:cytochrome d ubiquinol oxidase subunit II